jgi:amino acid adenylation domain-containing protein
MLELYEDFKTQYRLATLRPAEPLSAVPVSLQPAVEDRLTMMSKPGADEALKWWSRYLQGAEKLDLPTDYLSKPESSYKCIQVPFQISPDLSGKIQGLAKSEGLTTFDVLLALHACWLCRMSRQDDTTILTSHHNRNGKNADGVVGCFRTGFLVRLAPHGSFKSLLQAASKAKKEGLQHRDVPAMELLGLAGLDQKTPVLNYYSDRYKHAGIAASAAKAPFADGVQTSLVDLRKRSNNVDVEVNFSKDVHGCLCGFAVFSADLFSLATAERMVGHFSTLAVAAVADCSCDVWQLPLLARKEEMALDALHGPPAGPQPSMVELFSKCVQKAFGNIAVEYEPTGEQLTYGELGARVYGLAAHLRNIGVGRDTLTAIMLDRSIEMFVAINSVWWAGGAYVPVDPGAPARYVEFIVEDIHVHNAALVEEGCLSAVLTQSWILKRHELQQYFANVLSLDSFKPTLPSVGVEPLQGFPLAADLCYSIYTSGSTGRPKGVLLQHGGLANYISVMKATHGVVETDVVMQKTPYIFDVSLCEWGVPLASAAKLVLLEHEGHKDVAYVVDAIRRTGTTVARFVPSYLDIFLDHLKFANSRAGGKLDMPLRSVGASGEALQVPTCWAFLQLLPKADLFDLYGPTEATVEVTQLQCTGKALRDGKTIGQPLAGSQIYVANLSADTGCFTRTPIGLHGELLIGGVQVARGYLNLPEKTSEVFIDNPFLSGSSRSECSMSASKLDKVYRTGDVVKLRGDGHVVYLGRADSQVKLSGVRIEMGAIESAVGDCPGVRECVVQVVKGTRGTPMIVAYVAPASAAVEAVITHCRKILPQLQVPSSVFGVDEWPRTSSGKINRKLLPAPEHEANEDQRQSVDVIVAKITDLGIAGAVGDDEVQHFGWNSFQLMTLHADMLRKPEKYVGKSIDDVNNSQVTKGAIVAGTDAHQLSIGIISIVGHLWVFMMMLVLLEWLVAYWQWYHAVPNAASFNVSEFPVVESINALGRLLGDPLFVMLSGIQDMTDVRNGNTGQLLRKTVLFIGIAFIFTWTDRLILQGPFLRYGWVDATWATDTARMCGVLNGAVFVLARAVFIIVPLMLSMCKVSWISGFGVEWPWACIASALLFPALLAGIPDAGGTFGDGSFLDILAAMKDFLIDLSPYYFLYPLMVGGIRFPRGIASVKVGASTHQRSAITIVSIMLFVGMWKYLDLGSTSAVDTISRSHVKWRGFLENFNKVRQWPFLDLVGKSFDIYGAGVVACMLLTLAAIMPVTPSPLSGMGTQIIACYLTFPLTLIAGGHFIAPWFLHIYGPWRPVFVPIGILALLLLILSATTAQPLIPSTIAKWASD